MDLVTLLQKTHELGASDLHLQAGYPPQVRLAGQLVSVEGAPVLEDQTIREWFQQVAYEDAQVKLSEDRSVDFSFEIPNVVRFRVNAFFQSNQLALALRLVPMGILKFEDLNLPSTVEEIALSKRGLILVTGTTGSGKSTTLASIIDYINENRADRIITVEDPVEFVHKSKKSLVAQRELGPDTPSFLAALRVALRQDPDVILIGELRDPETMRTALQAADTGHVVYATMHTTNAMQTVQRMISLFPPDERELMIQQIASNLTAVMSQRLARCVNGKDRVPVIEILRNTPVVRKLLQENKVGALTKAMASQEQGMQLFDQHLAKLWQVELISGKEALRLSTNPEAISMAMRGLSTRDLGQSLVQ